MYITVYECLPYVSFFAWDQKGETTRPCPACHGVYFRPRVFPALVEWLRGRLNPLMACANEMILCTEEGMEGLSFAREAIDFKPVVPILPRTSGGRRYSGPPLFELWPIFESEPDWDQSSATKRVLCKVCGAAGYDSLWDEENNQFGAAVPGGPWEEWGIVRSYSNGIAVTDTFISQLPASLKRDVEFKPWGRVL